MGLRIDLVGNDVFVVCGGNDNLNQGIPFLGGGGREDDVPI